MDDILQEGGPIWTHFSIQATCKMCKDNVKIEWGVFSVLVTHLKQCHSQSIAFVPIDGDINEDDIDDTKIKDEHEQQDSFMEEKPESIFIDKRNEDDKTMDDIKINGEQEEKQKYFMEEMTEPKSSPVTINISKSDKAETPVKSKAGKNLFKPIKHYTIDPQDYTKLVCNHCGESVKRSSRKTHVKYWHNGYREFREFRKISPTLMER